MGAKLDQTAATPFPSERPFTSTAFRSLNFRDPTLQIFGSAIDRYAASLKSGHGDKRTIDRLTAIQDKLMSLQQTLWDNSGARRVAVRAPSNKSPTTKSLVAKIFRTLAPEASELLKTCLREYQKEQHSIAGIGDSAEGVRYRAERLTIISRINSLKAYSFRTNPSRRRY